MKAEMEIKKRCQGVRVNFYGPKCRKKGKKTQRKRCLHGREGVQGGEGSGSDAGDLVVVE